MVVAWKNAHCKAQKNVTGFQNCFESVSSKGKVVLQREMAEI